MKGSLLIDRVLKVGNHIVECKSTVRETAKHFKLSRSTVHKDLRFRLPKIDSKLSKMVDEVLEENKRERASRGGKAVQQKYKELKSEAE